MKKGIAVYDPFIGIGTTALACIRLGVNYLGTEVDREYVKIAYEKIARVKKEEELRFNEL